MDFSKSEIDQAFRMISARYFERNFGTMAKTDFETLLFSIYIEHLLDNNQPFDDYAMSKALGITQSKVRTLKLRKELQYPRAKFDWIKAFADDLKRASFDAESKKVRVLISDVNVLTELRYFMEKNGWYDEYQLNPRLFQCRVDFFLNIISKLAEESLSLDDEAERAIKEIEKQTPDGVVKKALKDILNGSIVDGTKKLLLYAGKEIGVKVLKKIPVAGATASEIAAALIDVISEKNEGKEA